MTNRPRAGILREWPGPKGVPSQRDRGGLGASPSGETDRPCPRFSRRRWRGAARRAPRPAPTAPGRCTSGSTPCTGSEPWPNRSEPTASRSSTIGARPQRLDGIGSLTRALRRQRPDAVHCHNISATVVGAPAAALARVPACIATRHGWARRDGAWRAELKFSIAARACSRVVAVCEAARRELAAAPLARPEPDRDHREWRRRRRRPPASHAPPCRSMRGGVGGAIELGQGPRHACSAPSPRHVSSGPRSSSTSSGTGPSGARLEGLGRHAGHPRRGAVPRRARRHRRLPERRATLFVLSSVTEGLPVALARGPGDGPDADRERRRRHARGGAAGRVSARSFRRGDVARARRRPGRPCARPATAGQPGRRRRGRRSSAITRFRGCVPTTTRC